ncbi:NUDIX hydrolase [Flavobacterium psychrotrophum]|uniref:NUDIX hydrolase n=1 Tax=Flavobacterium psychrotrophum TaxID=2294119 RepID=UPI000E30D3DA|nr:CoA pyrophosphatase [Flavobacterium psychrotrophum]
MLFSDFTNYIPKLLNEQLPAVAAHLKMAPVERKASLEPDYYLKNNPRNSAVMMLFYPKDREATIVLTKRNTYAGVHSAQISFPGGKAELTDKDLAYTALRETEEEIGLEPKDIHIVMPFTKIYIPPSNFLVSPFLGLMQHEPVFKPDPTEVAEIIELPLDLLLDDAIVRNVQLKTSFGDGIDVPAFNVGNHIVWGATAMILSELKETIKSVL